MSTPTLRRPTVFVPPYNPLPGEKRRKVLSTLLPWIGGAVVAVIAVAVLMVL